jgi:hypothetical protein
MGLENDFGGHQMKLAKSLLLGTAAGLATVAGAQAADLPSRKAAPVEYVRVCSTYGAGFFYIPGTDTCIRIGGRARYEYEYREAYARDNNQTGSRATGRIFMDARTATEYGLLRAYVRYDVMRRVGTMLSGTSNRTAYAFTGTGVDFNGRLQTTVDLNRAFVQLGGLTAGRTQSFFDFYAGDLEYVGTTAASSMTQNLLAYTASFGGGFSATLSIEDPVERRNLIWGVGGPFQPFIAAGTGIGNFVAPAVNPGITGSNYAGSGMPDVVGVLRYEGGWGAAQLSGAVHQVRAAGTLAGIGVVNTFGGYAPDTEYGFAVNGGVKINLPMLAPGDQLWLQGTYTHGASTYVISNPFGWGTTGLAGGGNVGALTVVDAVAIPNGGAGDLKLTTAWGLTAAFLHYWTPTIRQGFMASYLKTDYSSNTIAFANATTACGPILGGGVLGAGFNPCNGIKDSTYWTLGTNVTWSPVKDLDIGVEVDYLHWASNNGAVYSTQRGSQTFTAAQFGKLTSADSQWVGRFRIVRDF